MIKGPWRIMVMTTISAAVAALAKKTILGRFSLNANTKARITQAINITDSSAYLPIVIIGNRSFPLQVVEMNELGSTSYIQHFADFVQPSDAAFRAFCFKSIGFHYGNRNLWSNLSILLFARRHPRRVALLEDNLPHQRRIGKIRIRRRVGREIRDVVKHLREIGDVVKHLTIVVCLGFASEQRRAPGHSLPSWRFVLQPC